MNALLGKSILITSANRAVKPGSPFQDCGIRFAFDPVRATGHDFIALTSYWHLKIASDRGALPRACGDIPSKALVTNRPVFCEIAARHIRNQQYDVARVLAL
jgi:hypothetical protein